MADEPADRDAPPDPHRTGSVRIDARPPPGTHRTPGLWGPGIVPRIERAAARVPLRVAGRNPAHVAVRVVRRFVDVRVTGLAAEMTYYLALSVFPLLTALGASLGLLQRVVGDEAVTRMEDAIVDNLQLVLSQELTDEVVAPLVRDLLRTERVGVAVGGLAVALFLASRVFRAAIRALDDAYQVDERRGIAQQFVLALAFTLGAVVVATALLTAVVIGPLLGVGQSLADAVGAGSAYTVAWAYGRWVVLAVVAVLWLSWLYRAGPAVDNTWVQTLPGSVVAVVGLVLLSTGFRVYVEVAGPGAPDVASGSEALLAVTQFVAAALAVLLYAWLASVVVLLGGLLNAEWAHPAPPPPGPERLPGEGRPPTAPDGRLDPLTPPRPAPARRGEPSR